MIHSFNTEYAKKYDVIGATILQNIIFWSLKNKANQSNIYEGYVWIYNSVRAWGELFDYLSESQIKRELKKLEDAGVIKTGNYNKSAYDRTKWYAIIDESILQNEQLHLTKSSNELDEIVQPIPDVKPDCKPDKENVPSPRKELSQSEIDATTIAKYLFATITSFNPTFKNDWNKWVKDIELAIRLDKRTKDELINLINWIYNSKKGEFWIQNILSGKKLREKYDSINIQMIADKTSSQSSGNSPKTSKVFVPNSLLGKVFYNRYNQKCEFRVDGIWNHEQDRLIWDTDTVNSYIKSFSDKNILGEINASFKQV